MSLFKLILDNVVSIFIKRFFIIFSSIVLLNACNSLPINKQLSVGQNARVQSLVLHFTALNYQASMKALKDSGGVSSHYLIPERNDPTYPNSALEIIQLVEEDQRAWHAGRSYWDNRKGLNDTSIGIEVVNIPSCQHHPVVKHTHGGEYGVHKDCLFPDFDSEQIELLIGLAKQILERHPDIQPTHVVGHSDISPNRKNDPGPRFPWYQLYENGIGAWYEPETQGKYLQQFENFAPSVNLVQKALRYYGYNIKATGFIDKQTQDVLFAFQMHFLPWQVNGELNPETAATVFALLEKYKEAKLTLLMSDYDKEQAQYLGLSHKLQANSKHLIKTFYGVKGQGSLLLLHPEFSTLKDLTIAINGKALKFVNPIKVTTSGIKVDISNSVKSGNNVLEVTSKSDLSRASIDIVAPRLKPPAIWLERKLKNELTKGLTTLEQSFEFSLVQRDKVILHKGFGRAKVNSNIQLNQLTPFFTTQLAALKLAGENRLNLTSSVADYLPKYQGNAKANRTIKHLVNHSSGYPAVSTYLQSLAKSEAEQNSTATSGAIPANVNWKEHWKTQIFDVPFYYGVDQKYIYSEFNNYVLRLVIEQITNMPFEQFVKNELLFPLSLTDSRFRQVQNQTRSPNSQLTTRMEDMLVLTQLLKNKGSYGNQHIFKPSAYSRWLEKNPIWLLASTNTSSLNKLTNPQTCSPYLTQHSHIGVSENNLVLVDYKLDITVLISLQQSAINKKGYAHTKEADSNQCGLSLAQQNILNKTLEVVYQAQRN